MDKGKIIKFCHFASFILALCFLLKLARDWHVYNTTLNSAPFYLWVLVDAAYFLLPAACILIAGMFVQIKTRKQEHDTGTTR